MSTNEIVLTISGSDIETSRHLFRPSPNSVHDTEYHKWCTENLSKLLIEFSRHLEREMSLKVLHQMTSYIKFVHKGRFMTSTSTIAGQPKICMSSSWKNKEYRNSVLGRAYLSNDDQETYMQILCHQYEQQGQYDCYATLKLVVSMCYHLELHSAKLFYLCKFLQW